MLQLFVPVWRHQWLPYFYVPGAAGKRAALTHSRVMMHQPLGGVQGPSLGY